jgi:hypothetical protein
VSSNAGVLAHYESRTARPTQFIPRDVADVMVQRLAAERISQRVIRLLDPRSAFNAASPAGFPQPDNRPIDNSEPLNLQAAEIPGLRFVLDAERVARWRETRRRFAKEAVLLYRWAE